MKYRLAINLDGHWRRECRTSNRRYVLAMWRAFLDAGLDADVRRRVGKC